MNEASYNSALSTDIKRLMGGRTVKIADKATLGLPDSMHIQYGLVTFYECKISKSNNRAFVFPWAHINDNRQYEVCKKFSEHALVLYAVYFPFIKYSLVVSIRELENRRSNTSITVGPGRFFTPGHGADLIKARIIDYREQTWNTLGLLGGHR